MRAFGFVQAVAASVAVLCTLQVAQAHVFTEQECLSATTTILSAASIRETYAINWEVNKGALVQAVSEARDDPDTYIKDAADVELMTAVILALDAYPETAVLEFVKSFYAVCIESSTAKEI